MAQSRVKYIGSFADSTYGVDSEGELFFTVTDAVNALSARHRTGYSEQCYVIQTSGEITRSLFPAVSNDAYLMLWRLDEGDRLTLARIVADVADGAKLYDLLDYCEAEPDVVVWVGARQAIRHGSMSEFSEQRSVRGRQDAREAGSVVVTDA